MDTGVLGAMDTGLTEEADEGSVATAPTTTTRHAIASVEPRKAWAIVGSASLKGRSFSRSLNGWLGIALLGLGVIATAIPPIYVVYLAAKWAAQ